MLEYERACWHTGIRRLAAIDGPAIYASATAALFGLWILYFWQLLTVALDVPRVLLPAPTLIGAALSEHMGTLQTDFLQTVVKAVALGWLLGSSPSVSWVRSLEPMEKPSK